MLSTFLDPYPRKETHIVVMILFVNAVTVLVTALTVRADLLPFRDLLVTMRTVAPVEHRREPRPGTTPGIPGVVRAEVLANHVIYPFGSLGSSRRVASRTVIASESWGLVILSAPLIPSERANPS